MTDSSLATEILFLLRFYFLSKESFKRVNWVAFKLNQSRENFGVLLKIFFHMNLASFWVKESAFPREAGYFDTKYCIGKK